MWAACLLAVLLAAGGGNHRVTAQLDWTSLTSSDAAGWTYAYDLLGGVAPSSCCTWARWCQGGKVRFRCTPRVVAACGSSSTGNRCAACAACAASATDVAARATLAVTNSTHVRRCPSRPAAHNIPSSGKLTECYASLLPQACFDTLRPLRMSYDTIIGAPPTVTGGPPQRSGVFSRTGVAPAKNAASLSAGTPQFVVCSKVAFRCTSTWNGSACVGLRGARTPRKTSVFAVAWDTRGRAAQEGANAGGRLRMSVDYVYNPSYTTYDGGVAVERLPRDVGVIGENASDAALYNISEPAIRPSWRWSINASAPPAPPGPTGRR